MRWADAAAGTPVFIPVAGRAPKPSRGVSCGGPHACLPHAGPSPAAWGCAGAGGRGALLAGRVPPARPELLAWSRTVTADACWVVGLGAWRASGAWRVVPGRGWAGRGRSMMRTTGLLGPQTPCMLHDHDAHNGAAWMTDTMLAWTPNFYDDERTDQGLTCHARQASTPHHRCSLRAVSAGSWQGCQQTPTTPALSVWGCETGGKVHEGWSRGQLTAWPRHRWQTNAPRYACFMYHHRPICRRSEMLHATEPRGGLPIASGAVAQELRCVRRFPGRCRTPTP